VRELLSELQNAKWVNQSLLEFFEEKIVKLYEYPDYAIYVSKGLPVLLRIQLAEKDMLMPTLFIVNNLIKQLGSCVLPHVVVDEGAVKAILRGADVMIPGIREVVGTFLPGDVVAVLEPGKHYAVAVGISLIKSEDIKPGLRGKAIKNVNHLNDEIWKSCLEIAKSG